MKYKIYCFIKYSVFFSNLFKMRVSSHSLACTFTHLLPNQTRSFPLSSNNDLPFHTTLRQSAVKRYNNKNKLIYTSCVS